MKRTKRQPYKSKDKRHKANNIKQVVNNSVIRIESRHN